MDKQEAAAAQDRAQPDRDLDSASSCSGEVPSENGEEDVAFKPEDYMSSYKVPDGVGRRRKSR